MNEQVCSNVLPVSPSSLSDDNLIELSADQSSISKGKIYTLQGNASALSNEFSINADKIFFDSDRKFLNAENSIVFNDKNSLIISDSLQLDFDNNKTLKSFQSSIYDLNSNFNASAEEIVGNENEITLRFADFTNCSQDEKAWNINAENLLLNKTLNEGTAKNLVINFFDKPIFYLPYLEWALSGKKTGFLAPSFKLFNDINNNRSTFSSLPYYTVLSDDKDLLTRINYLSNRGLSINNKYRSLLYSNNSENGKIILDTALLKNDSLTNKDRWLFDTKISKNFDKDTNFNGRYYRVSDSNYFRDIALEGIAKESLISFSNFEKKINDFDLIIYSEDQQVVNAGSYDYVKEGQIKLSKSFSSEKISSKGLIDITNFHINDNSKTEGTRSLASLMLKKESEYSDFKNTSKINFLVRNYDLNNGNSFDKTNILFNNETSIDLERDLSINKRRIIQTLKPRIAFFYTNKTLHENLPNFDSEIIVPTYSNLFDGRKFTGSDRVSNQNSFVLGVETDFIDNKSGKTYLSAGLGQKFNLNDNEINIDGTEENIKNYSDIYYDMNLSVGKFNFISAVSFDPGKKSITNSNSSVNFSNENFSVKSGYVDFNDKYLTNSEKSTYISADYDFSDKYKAQINLNKSIKDSRYNSKEISLNYDSCCWGAKAALRKNHIGNENYDNEIEFEIVFKGLSSSANN